MKAKIYIDIGSNMLILGVVLCSWMMYEVISVHLPAGDFGPHKYFLFPSLILMVVGFLLLLFGIRKAGVSLVDASK